MADSQSKIDAAAEKAFAEAAEKKTSTAVAKPTASAPVAVAPIAAATAVRAEAGPKQLAGPKVKSVVKKAAPKKAVTKPAAKKATLREAPARKPVATAVKTIKPINTITQLKDKIMATTKTTDFAKTAQDAVADLQARAKAAYEKGTEMSADVTAFHKGNFDAVVEAGKILAAGVQDMGRTAAEDARSAAETLTADVKAIAAVKSPAELFQLQGEIARRNLDTLVARTSKNAEIVMKLANDMFAPISTRASVAMERLNKAA